MEETDFSVCFQELKSMEEKDSSSKFQEPIEEKDSSLRSEEPKTMEDLEVFVFIILGRKRVQAKLFPDSSSSAVANADSSAATTNDSTTTISMLPAPVSSSNAQSVPLSNEDGGNSSFIAGTTYRSGLGPSSTMVGSALSTTLSVSHLGISGTAISPTVTILSISNTTSSNPLVQDDLECHYDANKTQKHQFPNIDESSDPIISLNGKLPIHILVKKRNIMLFIYSLSFALFGTD